MLWSEFVRCVGFLRVACSRHRTYLWLAVVLVSWAARPDLLGVTSLVRASFLQEACYGALLNLFHSSAVSLPRLLDAWVRLVAKLFVPVSVGEYTVLVADGLKVAKEGKKMPAVKSLHQESNDNAKSEFIMGHSIQVVSMLVQAGTTQTLSVPLVSRICEGLKWGRVQDKFSLLDKLVAMVFDVTRTLQLPVLLVADAYYASRKVILPLREQGCHLVSRVKRNAVAYEAAPQPKIRGRGRPKKYGRKVQLRQLFKAANSFIDAPSPVYGECDVNVQYRCTDLLWRPVGETVRFVFVKHPVRGMIVLLCTDTNIDPLQIIRIYGLRFKIEVSFKQSLHTIGGYAYHFWMATMKPTKRFSGDQVLEKATSDYKRAIARKIDAYHRYIQLSCIVQGLLMHLAVNFRSQVWASFRSWLRTMKTDLVPSEMVVMQALRASLSEFLVRPPIPCKVTKFILAHTEADRMPGLTMDAA